MLGSEPCRDSSGRCIFVAEDNVDTSDGAAVTATPDAASKADFAINETGAPIQARTIDNVIAQESKVWRSCLADLDGSPISIIVPSNSKGHNKAVITAMGAVDGMEAPSRRHRNVPTCCWLKALTPLLVGNNSAIKFHQFLSDLPHEAADQVRQAVIGVTPFGNLTKGAAKQTDIAGNHDTT